MGFWHQINQFGRRKWSLKHTLYHERALYQGTGYANHYSMLLVSMTQHGELSSHQSGMCLGSIALLYLDPLDLFSSSKTGHFHAIKFFGEKCGISIFSPPPTGDSNETYQTEVWFIHLFRHHCGSMVSRAHGLSICGSGNCNALDRDFDGKKKKEPHFRQPRGFAGLMLCWMYYGNVLFLAEECKL